MKGREYIEVHPIEVRGTSYPVKLSPEGVFCAEAGGQLLKSPTRDGLEDKLRELTAKAQVKVAIPFTLMTAGNGLRGQTGPARGVATGIHVGNGNMMVEWRTGWLAGKKAQWTPSHYDVIFSGDVTDEDYATWSELRRAKIDAEHALNDYQVKHKLDLRSVVVAQIEEAVRGAGPS